MKYIIFILLGPEMHTREIMLWTNQEVVFLSPISRKFWTKKELTHRKWKCYIKNQNAFSFSWLKPGQISFHVFGPLQPAVVGIVIVTHNIFHTITPKSGASQQERVQKKWAKSGTWSHYKNTTTDTHALLSVLKNLAILAAHDKSKDDLPVTTLPLTRHQCRLIKSM